MADVITFHWGDYVVFVVFLIISALIGAIVGYRDRKKATAGEFLKGGGDLHYAPVSLSLVASFLSAIFVLGTPAEIYTFGFIYVYLGISYFIAYPLAGYIYLPMFHKLKLISAYEYLEIRFNKTVRRLGSLTFALMIILYMSVVLYTPALALSQVTGMSMVASIVGSGAICTFYTAVIVQGGMKATVLNDAFQMLVVIFCVVLLLIFGSIEVGGLTKVFDVAYEGGRINLNNFNPDPFIRMTFWTHVVGGIATNLVIYTSQTCIQKFLSIGTVKDAQKSVWLAACATFLLLILSAILGLVIYAYYAGCDPISLGRVQKSDQLVPLFVMEVIGHLHGLPGLFIASTFSAALSSVSGSLNALAAVFLIDFIKPIYEAKNGRVLKERTGNIISRALATFFGIVTIGMGFLAEVMGDLVLQIAISIFGMVGGPLLALLTLGMFFPFVNAWGAIAGLFSSLIISCWIGIGAIVAAIPSPILDVSTDQCPIDSAWNMTTVIPDLTTFVTTDVDIPPADEPLYIYRLSFMYYGFVAMIVAIVVALPVSFITGGQDLSKLDPRLIYSVSDNCCCCWPTTCKDACRCGVEQYHGDDDIVEISKDTGITDEPYTNSTKQSIDSTKEHNNGYITNIDSNGFQNKAYTIEETISTSL